MAIAVEATTNITLMGITAEQVAQVKAQALTAIQNKYLQFMTEYISNDANGNTKRANEMFAQMTQCVQAYQAIQETM